MGRGILDIAGHKYHDLSVIEFAGVSKQKAALWKCLCVCGREVITRSWMLRNGTKKDCGCRMNDIIKKRHIPHGHTKGGQWTPEYSSWKNMIRRCTCPDDRGWPYYGARGIVVCDRWKESFEKFYADMGPRPEGRSLDRIDVNGNYEPGNCRWATKREQILNRRQIYRCKRECLNIALDALEQIASWVTPDGTIEDRQYMQVMARDTINVVRVMDTTRRRIGEEGRKRKVPRHRSPTQNQIVDLIHAGITSRSAMLQNSEMGVGALSRALGRMKKHGKIIPLGNGSYALPAHDAAGGE